MTLSEHGRAGLTIVVGEGAEDVEHPLGRAVASSHLRVGGSVGLDPAVASASCRRGGLSELVSWLLSEEDVERVLLVGAVPLPADVQSVLARALPLDRVVRCDDAAEAPSLLAGASPTADAPAAGALRVEDRVPRVTLAMAVYNQEPYLHDVLESALSQTYDDYEVLVIDDGSTDSSPSIIDRFRGDPRLRVLSQSNIGQTGRMDLVNNRMARHSRGDLLAVVGGDDLCRPGRLAAQVQAFDDDPHLDVCHGGMAGIAADGVSLGIDYVTPHTFDEDSMLRTVVAANLVAHPTVMMKRGAHETVAMYSQGTASDYELWLKAAGRLRFRYLPLRLVDYRIHDKSLSTSAEGMAHVSAESRRLVKGLVGRRELADFYPELTALPSGAPWYAAALDLGNRFVQHEPSLALELYDRALTAHDGFEAHLNSAVAWMLLDDGAGALAAAGRAAARHPAAVPLRDFLQGGPPCGIGLAYRESELAAALARGRRARLPHHWDGSRVPSIYARVDLRQPDLVRRAVVGWAERTRADQGVRWVVPTSGEDASAVLEAVVEGGSGINLGSAAEVVIEHVDHMAVLPLDLSPKLEVVDEATLAAFLSSATARAGD